MVDGSQLDEVVRLLRHLIHEGRLVPGQRLVEADLVEQARASRARVREALRRLADEGLVQIDRNRGASVRRISRKEVEDTLEVLRPISILIAEKALDMRDLPNVRESLLASLDHARSFRQGITGQDQSRRYMDENARFWDSLAALGENPVLRDTRARLETTLFRLVLEGARITSDKDRWIALHEEIIEAVLSGDRPLVRHLVDESVLAVQGAMLSLPDHAFA